MVGKIQFFPVFGTYILEKRKNYKYHFWIRLVFQAQAFLLPYTFFCDRIAYHVPFRIYKALVDKKQAAKKQVVISTE